MLDIDKVAKIPKTIIIEENAKENKKREDQSMKKFCEVLFPDLKNNINKPDYLEGRTILAPTHREVDAINEVIQRWLPDDGIKLNSADIFRFNTKYLNTLRPKG